MLGEVAITPEVFRDCVYDNPKMAEAYFKLLREPLMHEVLVRDLHESEWYKFTISGTGVAPKGKELLKKLFNQKRLRRAQACGPTIPTDDAAWYREAAASHSVDALDCIITCAATKATNPQDPLSCLVEKVDTHAWWTGRSTSVRVQRSTQDYLKHLGRIMNCANSLMFIDPHIDPEARNYQEFFRLLRPCGRSVAPPRIEIHRVCYVGSGPARRIIDSTEWQRKFDAYLKPQLAGLNAPVEVFIWDDFHDRYLITDLIGISLPNGFDIDNAPDARTRWTRLGRGDLDNCTREFDPAAREHKLHHRFTLIV